MTIEEIMDSGAIGKIVSSYVSSTVQDRTGIGLTGITLRVIEGFELAIKAQYPQVERQEPAVPISKSVQPGYLICLEDGKKLKTLKRYLMAQYGLTPMEYRRKWGLPFDYPMVAPEYAKRRSTIAKDIGLGRHVRRRSTKK